MRRNIGSAQLKMRMIHLTIDGDNETVGGEDQMLVESVVKAGDTATVTLKGHARPKGGRSILVAGLYLAGASSQEYEHTSSSTSAVVLTTTSVGVHGTFGLTLLVNDSRIIYER